jgi:hypothetical protein
MKAAAVTSPPDVLPELAEADAPPSIKAIYSGLRRGSASPIAALIWRHIATHPGVLEECWASLEPLFTSGQLPETAWRVTRESAPKDLLPRIDPRAQWLLGINADDAATITAVAEAYNRANPVNLLGVLTLLARAEIDGPCETAAPIVGWSPPPAITRPLPRMTPPGEMLLEVRWLLNDLGFGDRSRLDTVVPSLYRHLTDWPAYLAVLHISLAPLFRDGTMAVHTTRVERAMAVEALALARQVRSAPKLAQVPALRTTMRRFTSNLIPQMIVVGRAISNQMSPQSPDRGTEQAA